MTDDLFARPTPERPAPGDELVKAGRYRLPDPTTGKTKPYTRATTFAKSISDTFRLSQWGARKTAEGIAKDASLYAKACTLDWENRDAGNGLVEEAKTVAGAKQRATLGTAAHAFSEQIDRGEEPFIPEPLRADLDAYRAAMADAGLEVVPGMIERTVLCDLFDVAGTLDRIVRTTRELVVRIGKLLVAIPKGTLLIFDLKTGRTLEYGWPEIAIQLALYANASGMLNREAWAWEPMPEGLSVDVGLVLHLPVGESTATLYAVDLSAGFQACRLCASVRTWRRASDLADVVTVAEGLTGEVRAASWSERVAAAPTIATLRRLKIDAERAGAWTAEVEAVAMARRDAIHADTVAG